MSSLHKKRELPARLRLVPCELVTRTPAGNTFKPSRMSNIKSQTPRSMKEVVRFLVTDAKANVEAKNEHGSTALMQASREGMEYAYQEGGVCRSRRYGVCLMMKVDKCSYWFFVLVLAVVVRDLAYVGNVLAVVVCP